MDMKQMIKNLIKKSRSVFGDSPIAFDGVVDEKAYIDSPIRTVFLLKEVNGEETEYKDGKKIVRQMEQDWDYTDWLYKQAYEDSAFYKTWPNVCLWAEILWNDDITYMDCMNEYGTFDNNRLRKNLAGIAIINIKKTPGSGSSDYEEINKAAENSENAELIRNEMDVLKPELIICGGTFDFAKKIFQAKAEDIHTLPSGAFYFMINHRIYLEFVHPMWFSVNRNILFAYAKEVFREVKTLRN